MSNYQVEVEQFKRNFSFLRKKRIVLYGIGRKTATLVPELGEWKIVGLMDKDEQNIGKTMYGIEIVSLGYAEEHADGIIINAPQMYWKIIYNRIKNAKIPVYYLDGNKADFEIRDYEDNDWWNEDNTLLREAIENCTSVSFDLYDTLIMRRTFLPQDIWILVESEIRKRGIRFANYVELRKLAISMCNIKYPNLWEIYETIRDLCDVDWDTLKQVYEIELQIENDIYVKREEIVNLLFYAQQLNKEVYIISDMHLPLDTIKVILSNIGIIIDDNCIYLSNERRMSKRDGSMWREFVADKIAGQHLHIGDDEVGDIEKPKQWGIITFKIKSPTELLIDSAIGEIASEVKTAYASATIGIIESEFLSNPYSLNGTKGKYYYQTPEQLGFGLFGPVIYTFLKWIKQECQDREIDNVFFFARDGYFLEQDFLYLNELEKDMNIQSHYLEVSRRACMVANITDRESLEDVVKFPYNGLFADFLCDRFSIQADERSLKYNNLLISSIKDFSMVWDAIMLYEKEIYEEARKERISYQEYLNKQNLEGNCAIVDMFFYGNTQYYLSKILNQNLTGFYFACDISETNRTTYNNKLYPCFQKMEDQHAEQCQILKMCLLIESFLTAPNGMLLKIDEDGKFVYSKSGRNQETFAYREQINEGVKKYFEVAEKWLGSIPLDCLFIDKYYGIMVSDGMVLSQELKDIFYFDNALIQRRELKILE